MIKLLAAIDGLNYSQTTEEFAIHLAKQMKAHVVGVFLDDFTRHSQGVYELMSSEGGLEETKLNSLEQEDKELRDQSKSRFKLACEEAGITYSIHHDRNIAIQELLKESIYADLLIIDSKETISHFTENPPTRFIKDLLSRVDCPVLLVPQSFYPIRKIILLYDGEPSSVFAIKSFCHLLDPLTGLESELIHVKAPNESEQLPDNRLMKEFMRMHFPKSVYTVLKGLPDVEIIDYLKDKHQHALVVLGGYNRGPLSRWLKPSVTNALIMEVSTPIFLAHY
ncbi:MAG: universal stress protein [Chitinophagales bacterium]